MPTKEQCVESLREYAKKMMKYAFYLDELCDDLNEGWDKNNDYNRLWAEAKRKSFSFLTKDKTGIEPTKEENDIWDLLMRSINEDIQSENLQIGKLCTYRPYRPDEDYDGDMDVGNVPNRMRGYK